MKRPASLDPRALARHVDPGQRLATIRRKADATRAAVRERVTGIRRDRVVVALLLVVAAVFIGVRFVPIDGVAAGVRTVLLTLGMFVLYRWFTKLEEEGAARLSEEHDEHEEDAAELLQMVKHAESIAEGYAKRGDPEKALEWNFRAWEFARRGRDSHTENIRRLRSGREQALRNGTFAVVAVISLYVALLAIFVVGLE